jgi:hypothetical protein
VIPAGSRGNGLRRPASSTLTTIPVAVSHERALPCGDPGACAIQGDLRDPHGILGHPELRAQIDLREPVVILLTAVLHFIPDEDQPYPLVDVVKAAMAPGSVVVISHATTNELSPHAVKQVQELYAQATAPAVPRSREEIARFFDSLELVRPGIVDAACWALLLGGMERKR